jgi:hypothetical protein
LIENTIKIAHYLKEIQKPYVVIMYFKSQFIQPVLVALGIAGFYLLLLYYQPRFIP